MDICVFLYVLLFTIFILNILYIIYQVVHDDGKRCSAWKYYRKGRGVGGGPS